MGVPAEVEGGGVVRPGGVVVTVADGAQPLHSVRQGPPGVRLTPWL